MHSTILQYIMQKSLSFFFHTMEEKKIMFIIEIAQN